MKIFTRYTVKSILTTFLVTLLIFSLLVMAIETFMHMDSFMTQEVSGLDIAKWGILALSKYILLLASISGLFSVTYYLSNLYANNEMISLYSAGFSKRRILMPIVWLSVIVSLCFFVMNETVGLTWKNRRDVVSQELFGVSGTYDASLVTLSDPQNGYLITAERYSESRMRLYSPVVVKAENDRVLKRISAEYADWEDGGWLFYNAVVTETEPEFRRESHPTYVEPEFTTEESLFKSKNMQMETMEMKDAVSYLSRLEEVNPTSWYEKMTDFGHRLSEPLGVMVLMFIALMLNYSFKKNVLLFSLVQSLVIAVVYYVSDMVFSIVTSQGMLSPYTIIWGPLLVTILLSGVLSLLGRKL